jgi:hypothetical protein
MKEPFTYFVPSDSRGEERATLWLLERAKALESPHFERLLRRVILSLFRRRVCLAAAANPLCTGTAAIWHTMLPNSAAGRLAARSSQ